MSKVLEEVLLLETPFLSQTGSEEVRAYVRSKYNLALLALGSYIKANSSLSISLLNMAKEKVGIKDLVDALKKSSTAIIGVSLYSYNLSQTYEVISLIKQEIPDIHICVGGPHVNIYPEETIRLEYVDSIVLGDGEVPFLNICKFVISHGALDSNSLPEGVYIKECLLKGVQMTPSFFEDLNRLPLPNLALLGDFTRYRDFISNKVMGLLFSSRGCPFVCHYCRSEKSKYRSFSVEYTINMMRHYKEMGVEYVEFWDETFNPNLRRLEQFADALLEADLGLTWSIRGAVVQHINLEVMFKLKKTGLRSIQFGVETVSPRLLKFLNKKIESDQVEMAFKICKQAGIRTAANLMINIPGQTEKEMALDLFFLKKLNPTYISISIYNWAPGTIHYISALENKLLKKDHWLEYALHPTGPEPVVHPVTEVPIEKVYKLRSQFVKSYYLNPCYLFEYVKMIDFSEVLPSIKIASLMLKSFVRDVMLKSIAR